MTFTGDQRDGRPAFVLHHAPIVYLVLFRLVGKLEGDLNGAVGDGGIMRNKGIGCGEGIVDQEMARLMCQRKGEVEAVGSGSGSDRRAFERLVGAVELDAGCDEVDDAQKEPTCEEEFDCTKHLETLLEACTLFLVASTTPIPFEEFPALAPVLRATYDQLFGLIYGVRGWGALLDICERMVGDFNIFDETRFRSRH